MQEFEVKFLEVSIPVLEKVLVTIGAQKVGEYNYSHTLFDYPDYRMNEQNSWLKLRTDGKETTLTFKQRLGVKSDDGSIPDDGMKEVEIVVGSYETARELLKSIGLIIKFELQSKRIRYKKGVTVFDIDQWPQLPPYIEVESVSMAEVEKSSKEIGFDPQKGLICSPKQVYKKYGYDMDDYSIMTFKKFVKRKNSGTI